MSAGLLLLAVVVALLGDVRPAGAHAIVVSSTPGDRAVLAEAPGEVTLEFNEAISADLGGLRVFGAGGDRVDRGASSVSDRTLSVGLDDGLDDGSYVVSYRIVSADGHPVSGGIVFTVGDAEPDSGSLAGLLDDDGDRPWEVAGAIARWLAMAGGLVVVGGVVFLSWCHRGPAGPWASKLLVIGAGAGVVGMLGAVPIQATLATGQGAGAVFQDGVLGPVLADGLGAATALGVLGLAVAAGALRRSRILAGVGALAVLVSFPLVGHTRVDDVVVGSIADVAHVAAAAVWTGGLVFLLVSRRHIPDPGTRAAVVGRFSTAATASIVVVGVAGLVLSWTEVRALEALTSTTYGWTLLAKVAVVALVAAAGAYNRQRLVPAVVAAPDSEPAQRRMTRVLGMEVAGVAIVVAVTAVLVNLTPAYVDAGIGQIHSEILDLGEAGSVQLVVEPNRAGDNSLHLYFYGPDGRPAEIADDVHIELAKPSDDIGPITRDPYRAGPAHFQWDGAELVSSGRWEVTVVARLDRFSEETATSDVLVG